MLFLRRDYLLINQLEVEGGEVGFVDFAEAEGVGDEAFVSFDFDKVFAISPAVEEGESQGDFIVVGFELPFSAVGVTGVLCHNFKLEL